MQDRRKRLPGLALVAGVKAVPFVDEPVAWATWRETVAEAGIAVGSGGLPTAAFVGSSVPAGLLVGVSPSAHVGPRLALRTSRQLRRGRPRAGPAQASEEGGR